MFLYKLRNFAPSFSAALSYLSLLSAPLLFLIAFSFFQVGEPPLPYQKNGRIQPASSLNEDAAVIASPRAQGWYRLDQLSEISPRDTLYRRDTFEKIQQATEKDRPALLKLAYQEEIAGRPMKKAFGKTLFYPTSLQLRLELFLKSFPFFWCLFLGYLVGIGLYRAMLFTFGWHTCLLIARIFILERPPIANMFETVFFVPWVVAAAGIAFGIWNKSGLFSKVASGEAALLTLVLAISYPSAAFDTVQAVLDKNQWLLIHVTMVVASYAFFCLSGIAAHLYILLSLFKRPHLEQLQRLIILSIFFGVSLLIPGTLLGGVWAAESWGRFWDWDPKESWAFISIAVHLFIIHGYYFNRFNPYTLAIGACLGFSAVIFTWYGVNYVLGTGLHSYGFSNGGTAAVVAFFIFEVIFLAIALIGMPKSGSLKLS